MKIANLDSARMPLVWHFVIPFALIFCGGLIALVFLSRSSSDKPVMAMSAEHAVQENVAVSSSIAVSVGDNDQTAVSDGGMGSSKAKASSNETLPLATDMTESAPPTELVARREAQTPTAGGNINAITGHSAPLVADLSASESSEKSAPSSPTAPASASNQDPSPQTGSPRATRHGFTQEEELFRALYGWGAFQSAQASSGDQEN